MKVPRCAGTANGYFTSEEIRSIEAARKYDGHASFVLAALAFPPPLYKRELCG